MKPMWLLLLFITATLLLCGITLAGLVLHVRELNRQAAEEAVAYAEHIRQLRGQLDVIERKLHSNRLRLERLERLRSRIESIKSDIQEANEASPKAIPKEREES